LADLQIFCSETTHGLKFNMMSMILEWSFYKVFDFCTNQKSKMATTTRHNLIEGNIGKRIKPCF